MFCKFKKDIGFNIILSIIIIYLGITFPIMCLKAASLVPSTHIHTASCVDVCNWELVVNWDNGSSIGYTISYSNPNFYKYPKYVRQNNYANDGGGRGPVGRKERGFFYFCKEDRGRSGSFSTVEDMYASNVYEIPFFVDGAKVFSQNVKQGSKLANPGTVNKPNMNFKGWYVSIDKLWNFDVDVIKGNTKLFAQYDKQQTYTLYYSSAIVFEESSGIEIKNLPPNETITVGSKFSVPSLIPSALGYTFSGWVDGENIPFDFSKEVSNNDIAYASFIKNIYNVEFFVPNNDLIFEDNSTSEHIEKISYGDYIVDYVPRKIDGYEFVGWYKDKDLINKWDRDNDFILDNTKVYAKYSILHDIDEDVIHYDGDIVKGNIYHKHTGTKASGGGCYGKRHTGYNETIIPCNGMMIYYPETDTTGCSSCGAGYQGDQSHRRCWHEERRTEPYTYYSINCGKDGSVVGNIALQKSTNEWRTSINLRATIVNYSMRLPINHIVWNDVVGEKREILVSENGIYNLGLVADANSDVSFRMLSLDIKNIDKTPPVIKAHSLEPSDWTSKNVTVNLEEVNDFQPDGTIGSGLSDNFISYDNGKTWTDLLSYTYRENGSYEIMTKDKLGNVGKYSLTISNIDRTAPEIVDVSKIPDKEWTKSYVELMIKKVIDLQPDGTKGSGFNEKMITFDGGITWSNIATMRYYKSGNYKVGIKDKLGNIKYFDYIIENIDITPPEISLSLSDNTLNLKEVDILISAIDYQKDRSMGVGLDDEPYSFANNNTFSNDTRYKITQNGTYLFYARDKLGNICSKEITINSLDTFAPSGILKVHKPTIFDKENAYITVVNISDMRPDGKEGIGINDKPYSYDNGNTWTDNAKVKANRSGKYEVIIRDRHLNQRTLSINVYDDDLIPYKEKDIIKYIKDETFKNPWKQVSPIKAIKDVLWLKDDIKKDYDNLQKNDVDNDIFAVNGKINTDSRVKNNYSLPVDAPDQGSEVVVIDDDSKGILGAKNISLPSTSSALIALALMAVPSLILLAAVAMLKKVALYEIITKNGNDKKKFLRFLNVNNVNGNYHIKLEDYNLMKGKKYVVTFLGFFNKTKEVLFIGNGDVCVARSSFLKSINLDI